MFDLRSKTSPLWIEAVFADFDAFLIDHAACERKASATGMTFVVRYPDRTPLIAPLIEFAREELEHFQIVYRLIEARGLKLGADYKDPYVNGLRAFHRLSPQQQLLDRLLVAGVVEARGCERLFLMAEALSAQGSELSSTYLELARAESRHHGLFFRLARELFDEREVAARADELLDVESELLARLPHRAAVH